VLLGLTNFPSSFRQTFLVDVLPIIPNCKHTRLRNGVPQIRTIKCVSQFDDGFVINVATLVDRCGVNLENLQSVLDFSLAVGRVGR